MKHKFVTSFGAIVSVITVCGVLFAHHGASVYDRQKLTNFKATVTEFRYVNPHVQIFFDAKDEKGNVVRWTCESINSGLDGIFDREMGWRYDRCGVGRV